MLARKKVFTIGWNQGKTEIRFSRRTPIGGGLELPRNARDQDLLRVADLDSQYQEAVKRNDSVTMDRILAHDFVLVTGTGKVYTKTDLLEEARSGRYQYEHQEDSDRTVRVWGDTAVVTAKLWAKGTEDGKQFEYKLWFSDTYVRTKEGWKYVLGQASTRQQNTT